MKKLLKRLVLWLVKILNLNLVEPLTIEHLKNMIYPVTHDYSGFKYKAYLVESRVVSFNTPQNLKMEFEAPMLIDCPTKEDLFKILSNIKNSLYLKNLSFTYHDENNICELTTTDFFCQNKLKSAINTAGKSQYKLKVDLLNGVTNVMKDQQFIPVQIDGKMGERLNSLKPIDVSVPDFDSPSTEGKSL